MLRALELCGFKSFADKTRFEFPAGVTAVVGPNGSGKSNVVDAVKWVLGSQSAKSLRGKEMVDVIFNGSGSRGPLNMAEVTLTFDNADGRLPVDTPEVHITRRVYRSGEGEYLINRQACRLRDIRDVCSGTGAATEAYAVIEQGKVDVLLQASPRDRRAIFEEAAGISRFKAKKIAALKRLERVDQNLLRLADIVDEVENRLKNVRSQATKARRYKQFTDRLQELRTQVGLADWRTLSEQLDSHDAELHSLAEQIAAAHAQVENKEVLALELESDVNSASEAIRESENRLAENRESIAANESAVQHQRARVRDLERELDRCRRQQADMHGRSGDLVRQRDDLLDRIQTANQEFESRHAGLTSAEHDQLTRTSRLEDYRRQHEAYQAEYLEKMRAATAASTEIANFDARINDIAQAQSQNQAQLVESDGELAQLDKAIADIEAHESEVDEVANQLVAQLDASRHTLADRRRLLSTAVQEAGQLRERTSAAKERANVLEELERRFEGLTAGAKEVLTRARSAEPGPYGQIAGLVADVIHVNLESAPLIDVALGDTSQYLVLGSDAAMDEVLRRERTRVTGRVGLVSAEQTNAGRARPDLSQQPGVIARATEFVESDSAHAGLVEHLLGNCWIVENLDVAGQLRDSISADTTLITLAGELVRGTSLVVIGPRSASGGLVSRRSELRVLREQISELETKLSGAAQGIEQLEGHIESEETRVATLTDHHQAAVSRRSEHRVERKAAQERRREVRRRRLAIERQLESAQNELGEATGQRDTHRDQLASLESDLARIELQTAAVTDQLEREQQGYRQHDDQITSSKVELAKSEERLANLREQLRQVETHQRERDTALAEIRQQLVQCRTRCGDANRAILTAGSQIAELYLSKERFAREVVVLMSQRRALRDRNAGVTAEVQAIRGTIHSLEEQHHQQDLSASEIRLKRETVASRLRDDYGIELAELEHEPTDEERHQREEVEAEIAELRRKINNIGNVNLESLAELEEIEQRHESLSTQYADLVQAKESLERIIHKINADSRRLFAETLESVKAHFQDLFRKLFGGGHADIVLEDEADLLECGIEIVARPPGKEPRSISLLSGGEKTLTCVALLLAVFRNRPSPFCILDEVDAALDEANIGRFISVLEEFLAWTHFIVVTHSKKTMTCASTLYGVTMQESGVSARVSVHFDDVREDGNFDVRSETNGDAQPPSADDAEDKDDVQAA